MAAAAAFPSLSAPEDSMQISSPGNLQFHDPDIDLDFGDNDYDGGVQLEEDEQMITDGESIQPITVTDDLMDDAVQHQETLVQEADMQDTPGSEPQQVADPDDEELIDYGDDEYFDQQQNEEVTLLAADQPQPSEVQHDDGFEHVENIVRQPEEVSFEHAALGKSDLTEHPESYVVDDAPPENSVADEGDAVVEQHTASAPVATATETANHDPTTDAVADTSTLTAAEHYAEHYPEYADAQGADAVSQPAFTVDTTAYAPSDGPPTPTDTGLHPITVYYHEHTMPLFKSKRQSDGLLKDDNLANLSLNELMRNCRQRLALKIGDISEDQELTLAFDRLGLMLVENSRAAFEHSLNDILEVYLHLHQNDGTTDIPPLSLSISLQHFSHQLALLRQAAEVGTGMSDFVPHGDAGHASEDENGEEQYDEHDSQKEIGRHLNENGQEGVGEEDAQYDEEQGQGYTYEADGHHQEEAVEAEENGEDATDHAEADVEGLYERTENAAAHDVEPYEEAADTRHDQTETAEHVNNHTSDGRTSANNTSPHNATTALSDQSLAAELTDDDVGTAEARQNEVSLFAESIASAPADNDDNGEYHIDWDGDEEKSLTSYNLEPTANILAEGEVSQAEPDTAHDNSELAEQTASANNQNEKFNGEARSRETDNNGHGHDDDKAVSQHDPYEDVYTVGEEFMFGLHAEAPGVTGNDYEDVYDDDEAEFHGLQYRTADALEEQEEEKYLETGDEQQHPHAAQGYRDEGDYEHGPEHLPDAEEYLAAYENTGEHHGPQPELDQENIGFDDDDDYDAEYQAAVAQPAKSGSPLGKRSFDKAAEDGFELEEPELKRAKAG
ncbi:hypothetical protein BAUCODRAFT_569465 [Baudoinia panamericana UAMH 10762]|uniref:Uncharacterized protein n=1 Tax=Baudoinia panamericana (strain UAMH 10762) TaxID=717646 RepID=M2LDX0_BAUPA|nr:uncharacterized protein BAUCODRAFT_569465 [Baudoinia panamericana UAMH 10762]EMC92182.1 hypothetical protein BAUCODRAFT_569465 [Baudoinia panamericana UAMH 10762]